MKKLFVIVLLVAAGKCYAWDALDSTTEMIRRSNDRFDTMLMINSQSSQAQSMWHASQQANRECPQIYVKVENGVNRQPRVIERPLYGIKLGE